MANKMLIAGMAKKRRFTFGVPLPAFFMPPKFIGPRRRPPVPEPPVEQFFLAAPEDVHNGVSFPRPHWQRDKPLGHLYKEDPRLLKKLRAGAAALQIEGGEQEVEEATIVEEEVEEVEEEIEAQGEEEEARVAPIEIPEGGFLPLWNLPDNPYARKNVKRVGRGIGSGKGKTCGRGQKGQKARRGHKPRLGFEGGQTPLRVRLPKKYESKSPFELQFKEVTLERLKEHILKGKIDPGKLITMKTLHDTRCSGKYIQDGVLLLGRGLKNFDIPIHIEVSRCTTAAKIAIEQAGGTVRKVHYNKLGMRALLDPLWFKKKGRLLPRAARPKPKIAPLVDAIGRLPAPVSPILPEGFVLKAPVCGHPWPPEGKNTKKADNDETKGGGGS